MTFQLRPARMTDAPGIARLAIRETHRLREDCDTGGYRHLLGTLVARAVEERLRSGRFRYWVGLQDGETCGICAMRGPAHLHHLFVAGARHGRGIGRRLWETARDDSLLHSPGLRAFTVNASSFAVPVYERFGFNRDGGALVKNGIRSWPMTLQIIP